MIGAGSHLGLVVIGRNEGERLVRALDALRDAGRPIVYVDSRSTDGSVDVAAGRGVPVCVLDASLPMNAARARNEGFRWLRAHHPALRHVQFVDGDTALAPGWLAAAERALEADPALGIVTGALAERQAARSVFHLLAALEWRRDPGPLEATGGIFAVRVDAFEAAGGFDPSVPSGEESELCRRVRARGLRIEQLAAEMGTHDMGDVGARVWWLRNVRTGHGYARGGETGRYRRELRSALAWAIGLPIAIAAACLVHPAALLLAGVYPLQAVRIARGVRARGFTWREAAWYGVFTVLAKAPEAAGALRYARERVAGRAPTLVRYR